MLGNWKSNSRTGSRLSGMNWKNGGTSITSITQLKLKDGTHLLNRKNDLKEIDTNDQEHVAVLRANHDHAIIDLKNYFNDIILNNMTLINAMKVSATLRPPKEIVLTDFLNITAGANERVS